MKEDNKKFLIPEDFNNRINRVMDFKKISLEKLCDILNNVVGYDITKNNLSIYIQRLPNINFLVALSKALGVSTDYLLGISNIDIFNSGFDYRFHEKRYKKYECTEYNFYYYPTVCNEPVKVNKAKLSIIYDSNYQAKLIIPTDEGGKKYYIGEFILSNDYNVGYITLKGVGFGEVVHLSFNDPIINGETLKTELLVGAMISVSSGDLNKMPVISRFVLSRDEICEDKMDSVKANLNLNSKYIKIDFDNFIKVVDQMNFDDNSKKSIISRLSSAFQKKEYFCFEESYILNTLANDFELSAKESMKLLINLRLHSIADAHCKINNKVDSRIFEYIRFD